MIDSLRSQSKSVCFPQNEENFSIKFLFFTYFLDIQGCTAGHTTKYLCGVLWGDNKNLSFSQLFYKKILPFNKYAFLVGVKSRSAREASCHPAFKGNYPTISHTC